ncbi:MAG: hypothetical protein A2Y40_08395 [Candidatus Margulisbacteria bacterium GWF2_35_9]|nr:MAG: hypothetical protein A2Y40_08395 [Candidatus Margulisbacteria bacterium GWF2_35_9]
MTTRLKNVVLLHQQITDPNAEDQLDTLVQIKNVNEAIIALGYDPLIKQVSPENLTSILPELKTAEFVFNLVEMEGRFLHLVPALLDFYAIPYSGCSAEAIYLTTDKVLSKTVLRQAILPTAEWYDPKTSSSAVPLENKRVIVKSIVEDASINIDDSSVKTFNSGQALNDFILDRNERLHDHFFAEEYIDGREFNISIIGPDSNPTVLPPAEMQFFNFPKDKAKIVSYAAKWEETTFEYKNTSRTFTFKDSDKKLLDELKQISLNCWKLFGLNAYARVDFRVDKHNRPWILEVNANPGIAEDSGFVAAAKESGLSYKEMIEIIIKAIRIPT